MINNIKYNLNIDNIYDLSDIMIDTQKNYLCFVIYYTTLSSYLRRKRKLNTERKIKDNKTSRKFIVLIVLMKK